jgi:hypothetical protein
MANWIETEAVHRFILFTGEEQADWFEGVCEAHKSELRENFNALIHDSGTGRCWRSGRRQLRGPADCDQITRRWAN